MEAKLPKKFETIEEAEKAVAMQGDHVRSLKSSNAEKHIIKEQVDILLKFKKELGNLRPNK